MTAHIPPPPTAGENPVASPLYISGSWGRGEGRSTSDLEVLAVLQPGDTPARVQAAYKQLLKTTGLQPDPCGVAPTSPLFSRSLEQWSAAIEAWLRHPTEGKALPFLGLVLDAVPVRQDTDPLLSRGPSALHHLVASHLCAAHTDRPVINRLLRAMLADWLAYPPKNLSRLRQALGGRMFVDLKKDVLAPITSLARIHAVASPDVHDGDGPLSVDGATDIDGALHIKATAAVNDDVHTAGSTGSDAPVRENLPAATPALQHPTSENPRHQIPVSLRSDGDLSVPHTSTFEDPAQWAIPATVWRLGREDALGILSAHEAAFLQQAYPQLLHWADECGEELTLYLSTTTPELQSLLRETTRLLRGIHKRARYVYTTLSEYS